MLPHGRAPGAVWTAYVAFFVPASLAFIAIFAFLAFLVISGNERSATSLRDVARFIKVFLWFTQHFSEQQEVRLLCHTFAVFELLRATAYHDT